MRRTKVRNQDLKKIGYYEVPILKLAGKICNQLIGQKQSSKEELLPLLQDLLNNPDHYTEPPFDQLALKVKEYQPANDLKRQEEAQYELKPTPIPYPIFGEQNIEAGALRQMNTAMQLPVAIAGALMPDAHEGYGLPIGGVLATEADKVIPYAVGVDIACRMCLSVFEIESDYLIKKRNQLKNLLLKNTCFGTGKGFENPMADDLFDQPAWRETKVIRDLRRKAIRQIGSSGTGNHFVEWGTIEILEDNPALGLPPGQYLALLSHSGSRGFGAGIAGHYTEIAMQKTKLPKFARHLAWLDLNTQEGQEYWIGMNLAGEYASANHHHIHHKMAQSLDVKPIKIIENHHNFAWKDTLADGTEVIVHRKGATPAHENEFGIIPGSMTAPGYLVQGKGKAEAIFSASHGAGRRLSRSKARKTLDEDDVQRVLKQHGVMLLGADLDEAPMAYKNIDEVMQMQTDLVKVVGKFSPSIVRMADKEKWMNKSKGRRDKNSGEISFNET